MLFAASVTAVLGSTAIVAGGEIAALPLYALIMVRNFNWPHEMDAIISLT